jgi:hypothetical protein
LTSSACIARTGQWCSGDAAASSLPPGDYKVRSTATDDNFNAQTSLSNGAKTQLAMPQFTADVAPNDGT